MLADLRALPREQQLAGAAAVVLALSLLLPWYVDREPRLESLSGITVFTWVEAAVLLIAVSIVVLIVLRARRRPFHLPGGDGSVIFAAGVWAAVLIAYRMVFDRPGSTDELGIEWGIFVSLLCAAALAWSGLRIRAAHRPEPPLPATVRVPAEEAGDGEGTAATEPLVGDVGGQREHERRQEDHPDP